MTCKGKEKFRDYETARMVAKRLRRNSGRTLIPYRCQECGAYHIGSRDNKTRFKNV